MLLVRVHHLFELRCHDTLVSTSERRFEVMWHKLQLEGFIYVSNQTPIFSSAYRKGNKKSNLYYQTEILVLHIKTALLISNIYHIYCVDISYIY